LTHAVDALYQPFPIIGHANALFLNLVTSFRGYDVAFCQLLPVFQPSAFTALEITAALPVSPTVGPIQAVGTLSQSDGSEAALSPGCQFSLGLSIAGSSWSPPTFSSSASSTLNVEMRSRECSAGGKVRVTLIRCGVKLSPAFVSNAVH
jgi:hypothetical protein